MRRFLRSSSPPLVLTMLFLSPAMGSPTHLVDEPPVRITTDDSGSNLVDFGRVAFGNIRLMPPPGTNASVIVHFGESLARGKIDRNPPGTVRYSKVEISLNEREPVVVSPEADERNTRQDQPDGATAILTPPEWGVVLPFRWVEIEGWKGRIEPGQIVRQAAYASNWNDEAAAFESSDEMLNRIWELCRYSIKATTFAGLYVDGDRERIPYEADAYLNQLSHYYTDNDVQMARDTFDHLMSHSTWPSEWAPHMIFMAYADWRQTGDTHWLSVRYEALKGKLLNERVGPDGLVTSNAQQIKWNDLIDWPPDERDGYVRTRVNTVVNAFHLRALNLMAEMAQGLGKSEDARHFATSAETANVAFQAQLFVESAGLYKDGVGTDHVSVHANLFPLAFHLAPEKFRERIADWLGGRGMKCSVYAAQYLLEALFENGADEQAVELMTAPNDRSWRHMIESDATITWEAWDLKYKPNQDWSHAWGAAPANLLPRYILGVEPLTPGWGTARIRPCLSGLTYARGKVPTPRGPIFVVWKKADAFELSIELPEGMKGQIELPAAFVTEGLLVNGQPMKATLQGSRWILDAKVEGSVNLQVPDGQR